MNSIALLLVLTSAMIHATWNLLVKRIGGGSVVVWMFTSLSSMVLVPAALVWIVIGPGRVSVLGAIFVVGTSLIHLAYFMALQGGYRTGDLSLVYPIARGIGPACATFAAIVLLGERPSGIALAGLAFVILGVVLLTSRRRHTMSRHVASAIYYGVLTGVLIGTYTTWDKYAVSRLDVSPLVLEAFAGLGVAAMLTPSSIRQWNAVRQAWRQSAREIVGVAVLAPASYILVLTAMSFTPLSYVAPAREVSILFAAVLGTKFLGESDASRRILAACAMVGGVVLLAVG